MAAGEGAVEGRGLDDFNRWGVSVCMDACENQNQNANEKSDKHMLFVCLYVSENEYVDGIVDENVNGKGDGDVNELWIRMWMGICR